MPSEQFRSGFVSIIGRPNVGKSTLLNSIMGEKIVITSDKPQTTRNRIKGIHNLPGAQIVFIDTPGIHRATSMLNRFMVDEALASIKEVDVILFLVEADARVESEESLILELLATEKTTPVLLVMNKIDLVPKTALLQSIERYPAAIPSGKSFRFPPLPGTVSGWLSRRCGVICRKGHCTFRTRF